LISRFFNEFRAPVRGYPVLGGPDGRKHRELEQDPQHSRFQEQGSWKPTKSFQENKQASHSIDSMAAMEFSL
jgi:hypothetical protein